MNNPAFELYRDLCVFKSISGLTEEETEQIIAFMIETIPMTLTVNFNGDEIPLEITDPTFKLQLWLSARNLQEVTANDICGELAKYFAANPRFQFAELPEELQQNILKYTAGETQIELVSKDVRRIQREINRPLYLQNGGCSIADTPVECLANNLIKILDIPDFDYSIRITKVDDITDITISKTEGEENSYEVTSNSDLYTDLIEEYFFDHDIDDVLYRDIDRDVFKQFLITVLSDSPDTTNISILYKNPDDVKVIDQIDSIILLPGYIKRDKITLDSINIKEQVSTFLSYISGLLNL